MNYSQNGENQLPASAGLVDGLITMVQTPTKLIELLRNIKVAVDEDVLVNSRFYSDENLKMWFGGRSIKRDGSDKSTKRDRIEVMDFNDAITKEISAVDAPMSVGIRRNHMEGRSEVRLDLCFRDQYKQLSFENVAPVFGEGWEEYPYFPHPRGRIFKAATHPMGNRRIRYLHDDAIVKQSIVLEFQSDGTLYTLDVHGEGKVAPDVQVGDLWRYRSLDGFTNEVTLEFSQRVVEINDLEIVVQLQNKNTTQRQLRFYNRDWNSVDMGDVKYDPFYPDHKFPMSVGMAWQQEFLSTKVGGQSYSMFSNAKIVTLEKVKVPAGVFDAFRIENDIETISTDANADSSQAHIITWYAPALRKYVRRESVVSSGGRVRSKKIDELIEYSLRDKRV